MQLLMKSIKLKNFRGYGENKKEEDGFYCFDNLDRDFVLINGFNGYGKTSFYEAIEWCLSDSVKRLRKLEDVYMIPDLKKGKYLKFQKANGESTSEREVVVEIQFINQASQQVTTVTRRTKSDMLGVGEYTSTLSMQQGEESPSEIRLEELDSVLFSLNNPVAPQSEVPEINKFLFSNILTQENLHDFLYTNDLKERQQLFLKLMSNGETQTIRQRLNGVKAVHFTNKISAVEKEMKTRREAIETIVAKVQISDIQQYFEKIRTELNEIQHELEQRVAVHIPLPVQMDNYGAFTQQLSLARQNITNKQLSVSQMLTDLRVERGKLEEIQLIQQAVGVLQKEAAIEVLGAHRLGELNERLLENKTQLSVQQSSLEHQLTRQNLAIEQYDILLRVGKTVRIALLNKDSTFIQPLEQFVKSVPPKIWEQNKGEIDHKHLIKLDEGLRIEISRIQKQIQENEQQLSHQQTLSDQHSDFLQVVSSYIHKQTELDQCPVCDSPTIKNQQMSKQGLLNFIAETIAQGNKMTSTLVMNQQILKETLIVHQKELEVLRKQVLNMIEKIEVFSKQVANEEKEEYKKHFEIIQTVTLRVKSDELQLQQMAESIRVLDLPSDFTQQQILAFQEEIKSAVTQVRDKLPIELRHLTVTDVEKELQGRKEGLKMNALKQQVEAWVADNEQQELRLAQLSQQLAKVDGWLLKEQELPLLQKQHQFEQELIELQQVVDTVTQYKSDFETLKRNLENEERLIIQAQLENHPIITWIFKTINPHPFYKDLEIINEKGKTQLKSKGNEIQLDQIFSAAQTNILVLSIFLGLGMTQKYSSLGQLFLDDPIQSMDDVNILAFIDLLRTILDSTSEKNNLVISTHDSNFAKLLRIKMRNRPLVEYRLIGYDEEGPLIDMSMNN